MSKRREWYRRFPSDFIYASAGLTLKEKGALSVLLDLIVLHGKVLPDHPRNIAGVLGCSVRKWREIRERLIAGNFITIGPDGIDAPALRQWARWTGRETVPAHLRAVIRERDGGACVYCGNTDGPFHIDHVHPLSQGGSSALDNLALACVPCNLSKGAKTVREWLQ